jgi:coenzyme F420-0:L-glutamate ligase/coenzyme F420-1:gamma-L-glutamate ligase
MTNSSSIFLKFLRSRRTHRVYRKNRVSQEKIKKIIEVAISAPSAHNSQPWKFFSLDSPKVRLRLVDQMIKAWKSAMEADDRQPELIVNTLDKFRRRFLLSPVLILCCVDHRPLYYDRYKDESRKNFERILGHHSLAAAVQNMLMGAHALGVAACWYSAPLFCQEAVRKALGLDSWLEPCVLLTMGYPRRPPALKKTKRLSEVFSKL